jgi:hypothetical protein
VDAEAFMELGGVTRARIVDELGAIAFSDIGNYVDWDNNVEHVAADLGGVEVENGDTPADKVRVITNRVVLTPSHKIACDQRRAIAKVAQDRYGNVRIEMHDKIAALKMLGTALGMSQTRLRRLSSPVRRTSLPPSSTKTAPTFGQRRGSLHPGQWDVPETKASEVL